MDTTIGIDSSCDSEAEEIPGRLVRRSDMKRAEHGLLFFDCLLKPDRRDLPGSGMNPFVIVVIDLLFQDLFGFIDSRYSVS